MAQRSIRFSEKLDETISRIAADEDRSFSWVVTRTLESALGEIPAGRQSPVSSRAPVEKGSDTRKGASSQGTPAPSRLARPSLRDTWSR